MAWDAEREAKHEGKVGKCRFPAQEVSGGCIDPVWRAWPVIPPGACSSHRPPGHTCVNTRLVQLFSLPSRVCCRYNLQSVIINVLMQCGGGRGWHSELAGVAPQPWPPLRAHHAPNYLRDFTNAVFCCNEQ